MQRPLRLCHELLGAAAQDDGASLALGDATEEVKPLASDLIEGVILLEQAQKDSFFAHKYALQANKWYKMQTCFSSKVSQSPRVASFRSWTVV